MNINKYAAEGRLTGAVPKDGDMALIAGMGKAPAAKEDIYIFELMLCDSRVDRDMERFDPDALAELGRLFVGKPGIFDHNWSAHEQVARIYKTQVRSIKTEEGPEQGLFAWAYMLRGGENDQLIRSIEAGIRREVSISCAVAAKRCSVCGQEYGHCHHQKGIEYDGQICHVVLAEPTDAYEWSFVAVPAQREAGVVKKYGGEEMDIRKALEDSGHEQLIAQLDTLEKQARLGISYLQALKDEVVRLGGLADCGVAPATLKAMADKLDEQELLALKKAYGERIKGMYPTASQLTGRAEGFSGGENSQYRV